MDRGMTGAMFLEAACAHLTHSGLVLKEEPSTVKYRFQVSSERNLRVEETNKQTNSPAFTNVFKEKNMFW